MDYEINPSLTHLIEDLHEPLFLPYEKRSFLAVRIQTGITNQKFQEETNLLVRAGLWATNFYKAHGWSRNLPI